MAWWWSSSSSPPSDPSDNVPNKPSNHAEITTTRPPPASQHPAHTSTSEPTNASFPPADSPPDRPLSRDDLALLEFQQALADSPTTPDGTPKHIAALPPAPADEDTFYPSTMSCRQAFDQAYACSSLGGQVRNLYRYGGMRACDELWYAWRFCMRTKAMETEEARRRIREWNKAKAARVKLGRNSEEVWEMRTEPVELGFVRKARNEVDGVMEGEDEML